MENSKGVLGNVSVILLQCNEYRLAHLKSVSAWGVWNSWLLVNVCKSRKNIHDMVLIMKMTDCHGVTCKYLCGSGWWCNCRALNVWNATKLQGWNWKDSQSVSEGSGSGLLSHWAVLPKRTSGWGQSGFIAGIQAQAAFLCWVSLVYQKAIWLACVPAAPLSTRQRACPSTLINCCTELCLFKFQRTVQGMWESMDMLIKSLTSSSLIYTCAPDTAHGGWWLGTQAAGCKTSHTDPALPTPLSHIRLEAARICVPYASHERGLLSGCW